MIKTGYPDEDGSLERKWDYVLLRIIPRKGMEIVWCACVPHLKEEICCLSIVELFWDNL